MFPVLPSSLASPDAPVEPRIIAGDNVPADLLPPDDVVTTEDRHEAYHARHSWKGQPLQPYSFQRQAMFRAARLFTPLGYSQLPDAYSPERMAEAGLLLYLIATDDETLMEIMHKPADVLKASFQWVDANVADTEMDEAGTLAFQVLKEGRINIAIPQPRGGKIKGEGN